MDNGPYRKSISLPEACRVAGISRATGERLIRQYPQRIPAYERVGNLRLFPWDLATILHDLLAEERPHDDGGRRP